MSLAETVRTSARRANVQKASDLAARLDALRTKEIQNSGDLVEAFRPLVEMMADLLRDVEAGRAQTADMVDRMEGALNRLELAMGEAPTQLQQAVAQSTEGQAERLATVAEAMERIARTVRGRLGESLKQASETGKALKHAGQDVNALLPQMQGAIQAMQRAAEDAGKRRFLGPFLMMVGTALLTSALSAWLVSRMAGLPLPWPL